MKRIKKQAAKWGLAGEYFNCGDLKRHFGLDCSAATIANALKTPGEVRARQCCDCSGTFRGTLPYGEVAIP